MIHICTGLPLLAPNPCVGSVLSPSCPSVDGRARLRIAYFFLRTSSFGIVCTRFPFAVHLQFLRRLLLLLRHTAFFVGISFCIFVCAGSVLSLFIPSVDRSAGVLLTTVGLILAPGIRSFWLGAHVSWYLAFTVVHRFCSVCFFCPSQCYSRMASGHSSLQLLRLVFRSA